LKVWRQDEITTTFAFASSIFIIDYISIYDHLLYSCLPRPSFPTSKGRYTNVDYSSAMSSPIFIRFLLHFSPPFLFSSSFFSCSAYRRGGSIAIADVRICSTCTAVRMDVVDGIWETRGRRSNPDRNGTCCFV
jgi:hypothetical protein